MTLMFLYFVICCVLGQADKIIVGIKALMGAPKFLCIYISTSLNIILSRSDAVLGVASKPTHCWSYKFNCICRSDKILAATPMYVFICHCWLLLKTSTISRKHSFNQKKNYWISQWQILTLTASIIFCQASIEAVPPEVSRKYGISCPTIRELQNNNVQVPCKKRLEPYDKGERLTYKTNLHYHMK